MKHLLNLLAAIALLVWGTHLVRTGILRVFGANLRHILAQATGNRVTAATGRCGCNSSGAIKHSDCAYRFSICWARYGDTDSCIGRYAGSRCGHQFDGGGLSLST